MAKILISLIYLLLGSVLYAQECFNFFPTKDRAILEYKLYDQNNSLRGIILYKTSTSEGKIDVNYIVEDSREKILDNGTVNSYCENGVFYLDIMNHVSMLDGYYKRNNECIGDFLDYPNTFDPKNTITNNFSLKGAQFVVKDKDTKQIIASIKIENRIYEKNEQINTPIGNILAAKVNFSYEVTLEGITKIYRGIEWYAPQLSIVRSELYENEELTSFTLLSSKRGIR